MNKTPAQMFAQVFGAIYVLVGIAGFFVTGDADFAGPDGSLLLGLEVNVLHNIVHLAIGGLLFWGARTPESAKQINTIVAVVLGLVGVLGFFVDGEANFLALNTVDNLIHLASAALGLTIGRQTQRTGTAARA